MKNKKECLSIKLMAEQEVVLFRQQLQALRQALARAQADNMRMRQQQDSQVSECQNLSSSLSLCFAKLNVATRSSPCCP